MATGPQSNDPPGLEPPTDPEAYRYERKFVVSAMSARDIEFVIKTHPALFRATYPKRWVNNIYFDDPGLAAYVESVRGNRDRHKVRVRWYGPGIDTAVEPRLEIKVKKGFLGTKVTFGLAPFALDGGLRGTFLRLAMAGAGVPAALKATLGSLRPTLANRYLRRYFQSADGRFRMTVDTGLEYFPIRPKGPIFTGGCRDGASVVEVKYAYEWSDDADRIIARLPFRLIRNSKYVNGVERVVL
jgi:hypothetical protein